MVLTRNRAARILVVEAEEDNANLVRRMLQDAGHDVTIVTSSNQARSLLANNEVRCDLVVTDLNLPDLDGLELTQRLRVFRPGLPVVVMTARLASFGPRIGTSAAAARTTGTSKVTVTVTRSPWRLRAVVWTTVTVTGVDGAPSTAAKVELRTWASMVAADG